MMSWIRPNTACLCQTVMASTRLHGSQPLLSLPSTPAAFDLLDRCVAEGLAIQVIGHPAQMNAWHASWAGPVHSPLTLWREVKSLPALPFGIAVFQDQLVAVDDSYLSVDVDGQTYLVSPIELMVMTRFAPPVWLGMAEPSSRRHKPSFLALHLYDTGVPAVSMQGALEALMKEILSPLIACQDQEQLNDWHARARFPLKRRGHTQAAVSQRLQEIEALVRIYHHRHGEPAALAALMPSLRESRKALLADLA